MALDHADNAGPVGIGMACQSGRPRRVAVTGFGPFPGVTVNASAAFAEQLTGVLNRNIPRCQANTFALPTSWSRINGAAAALSDEAQPDLSLHFGVSARIQDFEIETRAFNGTKRKKDCDGALPGHSALIAQAPALLNNEMMAVHGARRLAARGLPVTLSADPGRYLCNALYYHMLWRVRQQAAPRIVLFVHLPVNLGQKGALPFEIALVCGLELALAALEPAAVVALSAASPGVSVAAGSR